MLGALDETAKAPVTVPPVSMLQLLGIAGGFEGVEANSIDPPEEESVHNLELPVGKPPPATAIPPSRVPKPGGAPSGETEIVAADTLRNHAKAETLLMRSGWTEML